jgi:hypothetical protein
MPNIDLDEIARRIDEDRRERGEEQPTLVLKGTTFLLPFDLPALAAFAFQKEDIEGGFNLLLEEQAPAFWALGPSISDLQVIAAQIGPLYKIPGHAAVAIPNPPATEQPASP